MDAICGFIQRDDRPPAEPSPLARMAAALPLHAGGDVQTHDLPGGGFAAHRGVVDPADRDGPRNWARDPDLTVVCAAELYAAASLCRQLGLASGAGEAAIIAALYRRHGSECVRYLRGAFAFAVWDAAAARLLLATDPFAIQPLHYAGDARGVVFGSRLAAVLQAAHVSRDVDLDSVFHYFFYSCVPTPRTIYAAVAKLPPGHLLTLSSAGLNVERYWDLSYDAERFADGAAIPEYLAAAVRSQATYAGRSDRVGAFLSGGTDSSAVAGLLGKALRKPARTFSIGFGEEEFNEIAYARLAARHFGAEHHEYFVTPQDTAAFLPRLARAYDEPFGNASAVAVYHCAALARAHGVETLLAGDGGDELFGGNTRYVQSSLFELYDLLPPWFRARVFEPALFRLPSNVRLFDKAQRYARRANLPQPRRFLSYNLLYEIEPAEMFADSFLEAVRIDGPLTLASEHYRAAARGSMLDRLLYLDLKIAITDNDLRKVTRMCELAGVRARYPMLDRDLVEYSARIPAHGKVRRLRARRAFKKAFAGFLPEEVLRKPKHGFGVPVSRWLRQPPLSELARDTLLSRDCLQRGYLKPGFVEKLFALHRDDRTNFFGDSLWTLLMLELWHQANRGA